jgi:hypothetical protein
VILDSSPFSQSPSHHLRLALDVRDEPARPADVSNGRAAFSLVPSKLEHPHDADFLYRNVRSCQGLKLPVEAVWTTLKEYPVLKSEYGPAGKSKTIIGYEQRGVVWQAEELRSGNGWRRYYGFVGRHCIAKVPAEEIDFPGDGDSPLGPAFDGSVVPVFADNPKREGAIRLGVFRLGSPMMCKLVVRNHTGLDRPLPPLIEKHPGVVASPGSFIFDVQLDYTPYNCEDEKVAGMPPPLPGTLFWNLLPWKTVPRRIGSRLEPNRPPQPLPPTEDFTVVEFDLAKLFEITHSGSYELRVKFAEAGKNAAKQGEEEYHDYVSFLIADPLSNAPPKTPRADR